MTTSRFISALGGLAGLVTTVAVVAPAAAGGFAIPEQTITAAGTGGAGAARDDEAGAAWTNPAALADGGGWRLGAGLVLAHPSIAATGENGDGAWSSQTENPWATPPHLDLAWSSGKLAVGIAAGVPFGGGVAWPVDWTGRFEIVRSRLEVFRVAPFAAWDLGRVRVGGGIHVDRGRLRVARQMDFIDMEGDVAIDLAGTGVGMHLAAWTRPSPATAVGLTYKSRTRLPLAGGADFTVPDAFSEKTPDQEAKATITLPDRVVLGGSWRRGRFTGLADLELTLWGTYDELAIDFTQEQTPDVHQATRWHTTLAARLGGEARVSSRLTARAGAAYDPSPAPDDTLAPSSPDATRTSLTAGASLAASRAFTLDAFAEYLHLGSRSTTGIESMDASFSGQAVFVGLGLRWTQPAR
jgi:long-chain fatty acid transport protein